MTTTVLPTVEVYFSQPGLNAAKRFCCFTYSRYRDQEEAVTPLLRRSPSDDVPLQRQAVLPAARARSLLSRQNLPLQSPGSSPSGALLHPTAAESISNTAPLPRTGVEAVTDATPTDGATARAESTPAFDDELQRQGGVSKTIKTRATRPPLPLRPSSPSTGNIPILSPPVLSRSSSRGNDVVTRRFAANSSPARSDEGSGLPSAHSSAIMNNDVPLSRAGVVSGTGGMTLDAGADVHRPSVAHYHTPGATAGVLQHEAASTPLAIRTPATSTAQSVTLTPASGPVNSGASLWRRAARAALSGTSSQLHSTAWALRAGQRGIARGRGRRGGGAGGLPGLGREDGIGENESLMGGGGGGAVEVYRVPGGARQEGRLGDDGGDAEEGGSGGGEVLEEGGRGLNVNVSLTAQGEGGRGDKLEVTVHIVFRISGVSETYIGASLAHLRRVEHIVCSSMGLGVGIFLRNLWRFLLVKSVTSPVFGDRQVCCPSGALSSTVFIGRFPAGPKFPSVFQPTCMSSLAKDAFRYPGWHR